MKGIDGKDEVGMVGGGVKEGIVIWTVTMPESKTVINKGIWFEWRSKQTKQKFKEIEKGRLQNKCV